jgi:hypothetical protein
MGEVAAKSAARAMPAEALRAMVDEFLARCRQPALLEPGQAPLELTASNSRWSVDARGLLVEAWDNSRTYARRVVAASASASGRMEVQVVQFGGRTATVTLADLDRPQARQLLLRGTRDVLRESLRRWLARQFAGWRVEEITAGTDLEHTLSPVYPRALLERGGRRVAALAAPPDRASADAALTYGLIWLAHVRPRGARGLALFLPESAAAHTALRLKWLTPPCRLFAYDGEGFEAELDPRDRGNLISEIGPCEPQASIGPDPHDPSRTSWRPEQHLEAILRRRIELLDAGLLPAPVYGQVPALAACDRGLIDLLAAGRDGRLSVIELKVTADPHLPIQALDYWLRVAHHAAAGDFSRQGYFPVFPLRSDPPRLLLVAPALAFHPTTETILDAFKPLVEVERIGLGVEWQLAPRVVLRARGAARPDRSNAGISPWQ